MGCVCNIKKEAALIKSRDVNLDFDTTLHENQATIYNNASFIEMRKGLKSNEVVNNKVINETIASGPIISLLKREVNNYNKKKKNHKENI